MDYKTYFSRGFYFSKKKRNDSFLNDWICLQVGGFFFQFHPKTRFSLAQTSSGDQSVLIIGLPVDLEDINAESQNITGKSVGVLEKSGFDDFLKYIAYLGGRFLAVVIKNLEQIIVVPDCHATYPCYYTEKNGGAFSSHINLLGLVEDLSVNELARSIVNSSDYIEPGGKYYPGLMLPYNQTLNVFPNCYVVNNWNSSEIVNKRFYPFFDSLEKPYLSKESIVLKFKDLLSRNIRGIVKDREFYISLTGGMDSGVVLSRVVSSDLRERAKSFTYFNQSARDNGSINDLISASNRAFLYNIPHKIVDLKPLDLNSEFHKMYTVNFRYGARFPSLARAYFEELPHDMLSLVSTCSETGTVFYQKRDFFEITPEVLAEKFSTSNIKNNKDVLQSFSDYIEHLDFKKSSLGAMDFYDIFYWEHRNSKWASLWYSEADLSHFTVVPFNQRGIIELMLSLSFEDRLNRYILKSSLIDF